MMERTLIMFVLTATGRMADVHRCVTQTELCGRRQRTKFRLQFCGTKFRLTREKISQELIHAFARLRGNMEDLHSGPNGLNVSIHRLEIELRHSRQIQLRYDGDIGGVEYRGIF